MPIHFAHVNMLYLLWLLPFVLILAVVAERLRRRDLGRFSSLAASAVNGPRKGRRRKLVLVLVSLFLLAAASAGFGVDPHFVKQEQRGREVVFLVDVSRSMLAQDLAPDRLGRAKLAMLDALPALRGDRVALVAFAGSASVVCPLTSDYTFFAESVRRLSPASASVGGSMMGDAIRYTLKRVFTTGGVIHKDIVLISDGGDEGSYPVKAASEAGAIGVRMLTIGLGNQTSGSRIPVDLGSHQYLVYRNQEVWTKLNPTLLRRVAEATPGGRFLDVATGTFDLGEIYRAFERDAPKSNLGDRTTTQYRQLFQLFLGAALLVLGIDLLAGLKIEREVRS